MSKEAEKFIEKYTTKDQNDWLVEKKDIIARFMESYHTEQLILSGVVKSLKDEDIPTFEEYTQNYGYKRIGNSNVYKNEGTYKDIEILLKEYKKEYCL